SSALFFSTPLLPPRSTLFPYTTLFRSWEWLRLARGLAVRHDGSATLHAGAETGDDAPDQGDEHERPQGGALQRVRDVDFHDRVRSEEHTSELQSPDHLVCRLLLEKKNK